jgi:predicted RNA-binding protein YlqC (UPF0109 family)
MHSKLEFLEIREVKMLKSAVPLDVRALELSESAATVIIETVKLLVERPEMVVVTTQTSSRSVNFLVKVAPDDVGAVVGKNGRTARSLRVLLNAFSRHSNVPFDLDIYAWRS